MNIENVKLSNLHLSAIVNVRHTKSSDGDAEMIASIRAVGLLHPLIGRRSNVTDNGYDIVDGARRLRALKKIHGKKDIEIPVIVRADDDGRSRSTSLAANIVRVALHPVDEYEAYARMIEDGHTTESIAVQFGSKKKWVAQRLQLAGLAPELREAWRIGKMEEDQAEALSCVPDHKRQCEVWEEATKKADQSWKSEPRSLRGAMMRAGVEQKDERVKFVGLDAYAFAGGLTSEDLFAEERICLNEALLDRLVDERLEEACDAYLAEGWSWALPESKVPGESWHRPTLDYTPWFTDEEREIVGAKKVNWNAKQKAEAAARERAITDPAARAKSGVILSLDRSGEIEVEWLRVMPDKGSDAEAEDDDAEDEKDGRIAQTRLDEIRDDPSKLVVPEDEPKVNWTLRESLSEQMTIALSRALALNPDMALSALCASLSISVKSYGASPLRLSTSDAWTGIAPQRDYDSDGNWPVSFEAMRSMSVSGRMSFLAQMVSMLLDLRHARHDQRRNWETARDPIAEALAAALDAGDVNRVIAAVFDPATYFTKVSATTCVEAIVEMDGHKSAMSKKKADLVAHATTKAKATGWLPRELRTPHYAPILVARAEGATRG